MTTRIEALSARLSPLINTIVEHPLYEELGTLPHLRIFMEQHVFAVWDFMCLLKELHSQIVSTRAPWFPPVDALSAHLIGSILAEEEGDVTEEGTYACHFDIYIRAMEKIGAPTQSIDTLLGLLRDGLSVNAALHKIVLRPGTRRFVLTTFSFFERPVHELAAAFVYGREGITAGMFIPIVEKIKATMNEAQQSQLMTLIYYFNRHIALDNEAHFPKALNLLANLIGDDDQKEKEAEAAARLALQARLDFLTDIQHGLKELHPD